MNIASIDIGTNTILLLIANISRTDGKIKPLVNEYRMPRIGRGLQPGGPISENSVKAMLDVMEEYSSIIKSGKCSHVIARATSAMRLASNSSYIISLVKEKFGIDIRVISGEEEARLSFLGAVSGVDSEKYVVIDIGGGSTEVIYGDRKNISFSKSFLGGVVSFTEKFIRHDPPLDAEIEELDKAIEEKFFELKDKFPPGFSIVAVAGTPTSLSCVKQGLRHYDESLVENSILTLEDVTRMAAEFSKLKASEILRLYPEIMKGREDVIFSGTLILKNLMKLLPSKSLIVSGRGIRYGAVIDFLEKL
ncbi:MAG: hypothetical protein HF314_00480 [Ignavibacteria bacterium]|jgi:exopolyphosphatase/guanosine-5'-triphosphate,3'-diphosphate pyrophosphatase|nr:hypothetical protein [Ignavibacteria bacterium]MCU7501527.1 hypothetical protein [Ignavibacteria bacterium]MCU7515957.1 hypothetical protein [Ignavibacteria bacterium]